MSHDAVKMKEELAKPLPLYSKVMRKYVVQTSIELLRGDIRRHRRILLEKETELEKILDGVACWGDVKLKPSDVFTSDKQWPDAIDNPHEWERLLHHFESIGVNNIEELIHTLRTRSNIVKYCEEENLQLPPGYDKSR